ncbi:hypothetical protein CH373_15285 [Leptospira perolatii]|uniref:Lipid/polyisoprenoid-binding YceI-like domain-containing protein n=1 Tax=Leptospira perolatii TaxID=2023191 RepID=A0A2M9ZJS4_9LEPT|nr:YceI family protein [Leptospira perolatii]PJZ69457.1 hypothetical protein CH360_10625 [Leptospira perolatii]PJZ72282.1 hypothetical protein CH373_15285 [Leptospira perolatii]
MRFFFRASLTFGFLLLLFSLNSISAQELKVSEKIITFVVDHPFETVNAECGKVVLEPSSFPSKDSYPKVSSIKIEIPFKYISSGDQNRDSTIIESLGYPTYKSVSFQSSKIVEAEGGWDVTGNLTINGVTKQIQVFASGTKDAGKVVVKGTFNVMMSDYNVVPPSLLFVKTREKVVINFQFTLQP